MATIHALMFCFPAQGHIVPFMHLAMKLISKGFIITFANTEHSIDRIRQSSATAAGNASPSEHDHHHPFRLVGIRDGLPPENCRDLGDPEVSDAICNMGGVFEELLQRLIVQEPPVSCLIMDAFLPFSKEVANKFKLPRAIFWTTSASVCAIHLHTDSLISQGIVPITAANNEELIDCIPGVSPLSPTDLPSSMQLETSDRVFRFFHRQVEDIHQADWVFINSFYEAESEAVDMLRSTRGNVLTVGPLLPPEFVQIKHGRFQTGVGASMWTEDHKCLQWLDKRDPASVLFVSFGSLARLTVELFKEFALGLQASKQPFLWVVRNTLVNSDDPSSILPEGFLASTEDQGLIIGWAPQLSVLSHPSVGGFLTHCGWNSVVESMCAGVPMIGWPQSYDQFPVCRLVVEGLNVGRRLKIRKAEEVKEEVELAVRAVMQGEEGREMRERICVVVREAACRAVGSAERNLEVFVEEMRRMR